MKRNRAGEDGLNPTSNDNRSVLESARPGRAGDRGSGGEQLGLLPQTPAPQDPICLAATGPTPRVSSSSPSFSQTPAQPTTSSPGCGHGHQFLPAPGQGQQGSEGGPCTWATLPGSTFCNHTLCVLGQVSLALKGG